MENNELFKVIEHLKRTLSDISSARQQVNDTVAAYSKTQTKIDSYVESLNGVEKGISRLVPLLQDINVLIEQQSNAAICNLEEACSSLFTNAKKEMASTSEEFSEHTLSSIGAMTKQIDEFERVIERAGTFFNKIDATSKEVAKIETLQGTVLNAVNMCQGQLRSLKDDFAQVKLDMVKEMKINRCVGLIVLVGIIAMAVFMFILK